MRGWAEGRMASSENQCARVLLVNRDADGGDVPGPPFLGHQREVTGDAERRREVAAPHGHVNRTATRIRNPSLEAFPRLASKVGH